MTEMITILPDVARPSAIDAFNNGGGYRQITATAFGTVNGTAEYRVEMVGHEVCGWTHPTWPDEEDDRLAAHKMTCELRGEDEAD